jgi:hypothetical protein
VFCKRPKIARKNIKAAAAEAAEIAAEAEAAARTEKTKRLAAEYEAMGGGSTEGSCRRPNPATHCASDASAHPAP